MYALVNCGRNNSTLLHYMYKMIWSIYIYTLNEGLKLHILDVLFFDKYDVVAVIQYCISNMCGEKDYEVKQPHLQKKIMKFTSQTKGVFWWLGQIFTPRQMFCPSHLALIKKFRHLGCFGLRGKCCWTKHIMTICIIKRRRRDAGVAPNLTLFRGKWNWRGYTFSQPPLPHMFGTLGANLGQI
jgi:hypothetical protein